MKNGPSKRSPARENIDGGRMVVSTRFDVIVGGKRCFCSFDRFSFLPRLFPRNEGQWASLFSPFQGIGEVWSGARDELL